jgi:hypothetical protein
MVAQELSRERGSNEPSIQQHYATEHHPGHPTSTTTLYEEPTKGVMFANRKERTSCETSESDFCLRRKSDFCQRHMNNERFYTYTFRWNQGPDAVLNEPSLTTTKKTQTHGSTYMFVSWGRAIPEFSTTCAKAC